jgi:hypothetical protein
MPHKNGQCLPPFRPPPLQRCTVPTLVNRVDGVGLSVGDLNGELLLDGHDDLDGVERVEAEVSRELGGGVELSVSMSTGSV